MHQTQYKPYSKLYVKYKYIHQLVDTVPITDKNMFL